MTASVYRIRNRVTGTVYIGSSQTMEFRLYTHYVALTRGRHDNRPLVQAWQEHGPKSFAFGILEVTASDNDSLAEAESRWMTHARDSGTTLYNVRKTGRTGRYDRVIRERPWLRGRPKGKP